MQAWILLAAAVCAPWLPAQAAADPYTRGEPAALARAGYVSLGPFAFGDDCDSMELGGELAPRQLCWIETVHFRLGVALPACGVPDRKPVVRNLGAELKRLAAKLPRVNPRVRTLDPWLRAHLFAQRCEELYAEVERRLDVTAASFPPLADPAAHDSYLGEGPYLGMRGKYLVLLLGDPAGLAKYLERVVGRGGQGPTRHLLRDCDSMLFVTSEWRADGSVLDDAALHAHTVFNLSHNLLAGFRHFWFDLPLWLGEGFAHWQARRIDPESFDYTCVTGDRDLAERRALEWPRRVRARVQHDAYEPAESMLPRGDPATLTAADHLLVWSRVDFLLSLGDAKFGQFVGRLKTRVPRTAPTADTMQQEQLAALHEVYGFDPPGFDRAWTTFVRARYR